MPECARCGRRNPIAPAVVFAHGKQAIYCHGDAVTTPTCYTLSSWDDYPELVETTGRIHEGSNE